MFFPTTVLPQRVKASLLAEKIKYSFRVICVTFTYTKSKMLRHALEILFSLHHSRQLMLHINENLRSTRDTLMISVSSLVKMDAGPISHHLAVQRFYTWRSFYLSQHSSNSAISHNCHLRLPSGSWGRFKTNSADLKRNRNEPGLILFH